MTKIVLIAGLLLAQLSFASVSKEGVACYKKYDFDCAFKAFYSSAQKGNVESQFLLGIMYSEGRGTAQNYFKAFEWYKKAAEQGYAPAQLGVAVMYSDGNGVKQNSFKAVEWYQKAAGQGLAQAQFSLGSMYYEGIGVKQNKKRAKILFGKACDNQNKDGCAAYRLLNEEGF